MWPTLTNQFITFLRIIQRKISKENFLEVDWLDISFKNKFDIIVGHRPFNVIGKKYC